MNLNYNYEVQANARRTHADIAFKFTHLISWGSLTKFDILLAKKTFKF